jgi:hypothetical protein
MPTLFAAAKPRLRPVSSSVTAGQRVRTRAGLPSVDPLSTTTT